MKLHDLVRSENVRGQLLRFVVAGGGVTLVSVFAYWLCAIPLGIRPMIANLIAQALNLVLGFNAHRIWSFRGHGDPARVHVAVGRYCAVSLCALIMNSGWIWLLTKLLHQTAWAPIIPMIVATPLVTFVLNRQWTFQTGRPVHDGSLQSFNKG